MISRLCCIYRCTRFIQKCFKQPDRNHNKYTADNYFEQSIRHGICQKKSCITLTAFSVNKK